MAAKKQDKAAISPERLEEIRLSALAGRHKSMFDDPTPDMDRFHGPTCRCGVRRKPPGLAKHVVDDGKCVIHTDKPPEPYVPGAGGIDG